MTPPQPPRKPQTVLGAITQAVQTIAKVNFNQLVLKPNAKVPELWVQDAGAAKAEVYPLLGDRYLLGRSSKSSDIVVRLASRHDCFVNIILHGLNSRPCGILFY